MLPHWKAPALMCGSLLAGLLLALGHHLYYGSLNNTAVSTANSLAIGGWSGMPSQKFHTSVGTAFASLVRTFLVVAVTTAYVQILWTALKARAVKVAVVDAVSGLLDNPFGFFGGSVWRKYSPLAALAGITWLLPIASIITPATLTVETVSRTSYNVLNVSTVDFNSLNFASILENSEGACGYQYQGPDFSVTKIATAVAAQGDILSVPAPQSRPNVSYVNEFAGPALKCSDVSDDLFNAMVSNINASSYNHLTSYGYLSWTPSADYLLPFSSNTNKSDYFQQLETLGPVPYALAGYNPGTGKPRVGPPTIFVATFSGMVDTYLLRGEYAVEPRNTTIVQCQLTNVTHHTAFNWTNGVRAIRTTTTPANGSVTAWEGITCDGAVNVPVLAKSIAQSFAYQAVMDAFGRLLVGSISINAYGLEDLSIEQTNVLNTVVGDVRELAHLRASARGDTGGTPGTDEAQTFVGDGTPNGRWPGFSVPDDSSSTTNLRSTLEDLFQNITLSLMSSALLQPDPRTPYYPPPTNVTFLSFHSVYAYSAWTLWLAYGLAIVLAAIAVTVACVTTFTSGLSYSNSFSTVLRTTSHAQLDTIISKADAVGTDPLPSHLANATIAFDREWQKESQTQDSVAAADASGTVPDARAGLLDGRYR